MYVPSNALVILTVALGAVVCFLHLSHDGKTLWISGQRTIRMFIRRLHQSHTLRVSSASPIRRTHDPFHAGAFQKLPAEIRILIYSHVVGHRLIHLVESDGRLRRRNCYSNENAEAWYHPCWKLGQYPQQYTVFHAQQGAPADQLIQLLLTCRHIYSEAIDLLYSANIFHFLRPADFLTLVNTVGPGKAAEIRSIKLYVNPTSSGTDLTYAAFWSVLENLPHVRELRLLIAPSVMTREVWKQHEPQLLEPIRSFRKNLDVFDVFLAVFPDWTEEVYLDACHLRQIKEMEQLSGAHLSRYT